MFGTVFLGIFPQSFYNAAEQSVQELRHEKKQLPVVEAPKVDETVAQD